MDSLSSPLPDESWATGIEGLRHLARDEHILSTNTLLAYQRTWRRLFAWAGASRLNAALLTAEQAARCYSEIVTSSGCVAPGSQGQARAALAYAYACWGRPNPFGGIRPTRNPPPQPAGCLLPQDLSRLLHRLGEQQATYGGSLTYHLASALFHTCARFSELARLRWSDRLLADTGRVTGLRLPGPRKDGVPAVLPVNAVLSALLDDWRAVQEQHRGMKIFAARGLKFCRSPYIFAGPGGEPYTNQSFNAHLKKACEGLRLSVVLTADGLRHSAALILLREQHKPLHEVQRTLRHRHIRTTAKYTSITRENTSPAPDAPKAGLVTWRWTQDGPPRTGPA